MLDDYDEEEKKESPDRGSEVDAVYVSNLENIQVLLVLRLTIQDSILMGVERHRWQKKTLESHMLRDEPQKLPCTAKSSVIYRSRRRCQH